MRQDLAVADQLVQFGHAVERMVSISGPAEGIPAIVGIGVPHQRSMDRVREKLRTCGVDHYEWSDPDFPGLGVTSIATFPLSGEARKVLANYRLYDPRANGVGAPALQTLAGLDAERGAKPS